MRVVLVEDDPRFAESMAFALRHSDGITFDGIYSTGEAALAAATSTWDIVLMDLDLPGINGTEATRTLKARLPGLSVVVLTVFEEPERILGAICAGADGYLLKRTPLPELLAGLRAVHAGGSPLTAAIARSVVELVRKVPIPTPSAARIDLTDRERDVLRALAAGRAYKQVADDLGVSLDTVRSHIRSLYRKLQVHSVSEAISRAFREGLV